MHITVSFATRNINKGHTTIQDDLYTIIFYYNTSKIVLSLFEYDKDAIMDSAVRVSRCYKTLFQSWWISVLYFFAKNKLKTKL